MVKRLCEHSAFTWQGIAEEIMRETISKNPRLFEEFVSATTNRRRVELCLTDGKIVGAINFQIWNRFDEFFEGKDDLRSAEFRAAGNAHFRRKRVDAAIAAYSMAVFKAEPESEAFALAVANRSACLFETGDFKECLEDVETTLASRKYPNRLKRKILNRKLECLKKLKRSLKEAEETFEDIKTLAKESNEGVEEDFDAMWRRFEEDWNGIEGEVEDASTKISNDDGPEHLNIQPSSFSDRISVKYSEALGRHLVADSAVDVGHQLVEEKAFAHILIPDSHSLNCQLCLKAKPNLIPCINCSEVGFCDEECREVAWKLFHAKECKYMSLLPGIGIAHLSHRIVNLVGVRKVVETRNKIALEDINNMELKYDKFGTDYASVFSLLTHEGETAPEDLFQYALTAILMLKMIADFDDTSKSAYEKMSEASHSEPDPDLLTIGEVLLRHIQQLICNASAITAVVGTPQGVPLATTTQDQVRIATAIFPRLSLLNHSCDPNVIVSYVGTAVTAKATRVIDKGAEVFNCYGPHHLRMNLGQRRSALRQQYHFRCLCSKCCEEEKNVGDGDNEDDVDEDASSPSLTAKALRCPKCEGPLISSEKNKKKFSCLGCRMKLAGEEAAGLVAKVRDLFKKREAVRLGAEASPGVASKETLNLMVAEAEHLLFKDSLDLAEVYDLVAFVFTNRDDFESALSFVKKSSDIVKSVYGETSVEFGYELRKLGEVALRLDDIESALEATRQSKRILERCYSSKHQDVAELAEVQKQLENILR